MFITSNAEGEFVEVNNKSYGKKPTWQQGKAYCGQCGCRIPLKIKARYCHKCGTKINWHEDKTNG